MSSEAGTQTESLQARLRCHEVSAGGAFATVLCLEAWAAIHWHLGWSHAALMAVAGWACFALLYAFAAPPLQLALRVWYERVPDFVVVWIVLGLAAWALSGPQQVWWYAVPMAAVTLLCARATKSLVVARLTGRGQPPERAPTTASAQR